MGQSHLDVPPPSSVSAPDFLQLPGTGSTVGAPLSAGGYPQTNGFAGSPGLTHAALLSGLLFALTGLSLSLSLCLPHVITRTDEKALLSLNAVINLLGI